MCSETIERQASLPSRLRLFRVFTVPPGRCGADATVMAGAMTGGSGGQRRGLGRSTQSHEKRSPAAEAVRLIRVAMSLRFPEGRLAPQAGLVPSRERSDRRRLKTAWGADELVPTLQSCRRQAAERSEAKENSEPNPKGLAPQAGLVPSRERSDRRRLKAAWGADDLAPTPQSCRRQAAERSEAKGDSEPNPKGLAPQAGLEPATLRLTAGCSAIELLRNTGGTAVVGRTS